ncbi:MAG: protein kinase, partial [Labilithrix sp.]|nr:protein kinase [Labilithrix sp.]
PSMIGRYRKIAALGHGGMSEVYLTVSEGPFNFNKLLVVKQLKHDLAEDDLFRAMFLDEARLAARLNHPNVVQTYEVGADGERHFIAMEYIDGQPLAALLRRLERKGVTIGQHATILAGVLSALDYAHDLRDFDGQPLGIVHRDVSPQNVIVTYEGQVKLVDFGVAKSTIAVAQTQAGVVKGKAGYMAPEQVASKPIDRRADVFAVGVMLWEALAERRLNTRDQDSARILVQRLKGDEPRLGDVAPDAPPELVRICERAMAVAPEDRYATAGEMRADIDTWLDENKLRASSRELGTLLRDVFAEKRSAMERMLNEQIKRSEAGESSHPPIDVPRWASGEATPPTQTRPEASGLTPAPQHPSQPQPQKKRPTTAIALTAIAALALVAFVSFSRSRQVTTSSSNAPRTPAPIVSTSATEAPSTAPSASTLASASTTTTPPSAAPSATVERPRQAAAAPVAPTWGRAAKPHDRPMSADLNQESPKPRRQIDEKDPYE